MRVKRVAFVFQLFEQTDFVLLNFEQLLLKDAKALLSEDKSWKGVRAGCLIRETHFPRGRDLKLEIEMVAGIVGKSYYLATSLQFKEHIVETWRNSFRL